MVHGCSSFMASCRVNSVVSKPCLGWDYTPPTTKLARKNSITAFVESSSSQLVELKPLKVQNQKHDRLHQAKGLRDTSHQHPACVSTMRLFQAANVTAPHSSDLSMPSIHPVSPQRGQRFPPAAALTHCRAEGTPSSPQ